MVMIRFKRSHSVEINRPAKQVMSHVVEPKNFLPSRLAAVLAPGQLIFESISGFGGNFSEFTHRWTSHAMDEPKEVVASGFIDWCDVDGLLIKPFPPEVWTIETDGLSDGLKEPDVTGQVSLTFEAEDIEKGWGHFGKWSQLTVTVWNPARRSRPTEETLERMDAAADSWLGLYKERIEEEDETE